VGKMFFSSLVENREGQMRSPEEGPAYTAGEGMKVGGTVSSRGGHQTERGRTEQKAYTVYHAAVYEQRMVPQRGRMGFPPPPRQAAAWRLAEQVARNTDSTGHSTV